MYNLTELSKDEIEYICGHMHLPCVRLYFQKYPKEFNKIKPGRIVKKMTDNDTLSFLLKYAQKPFVLTIIQFFVKEWLSQIQENRDLLEQQGYSSGEALLKTIPDCVFSDRIELYFKLTEQEFNDDYLGLFSDALSLIKKSSETSMEEYNTEIINAQIEESNKEITNLKEQLDESKRREETLQHELNDRNEQLQQYQAKINEANADLHNMDNELSEIRLELNHYHKLERYTEGEVDQSLFSKYQYTSIGQIIYDYNNKRRIFRLADISTNGVITPFVADENKPYCFANRDRLHWYDGPENENAIGIWNWNASPRYTDSEKDFVKTYYCNSISLIQIIELPNCESLDDVASLLIEGANYSIICDKVLFVLKDGTSFKGLLCSSKDFENTNEIIKLKPSVFTLPQYIIRNIDVIKIASIYIYNNVSLKIPTSIYQIRTPYKAVKSMLLSRITNSAMREYELSKKEVQRCRQFLKAIPTQTLMQELTLAYNCSKEEAQEYIDGFIDHADTYLSSTDLDVNIISRAIQGNAGLLELCKQQLTEEWETENAERLAEAETKIKSIINSIEKKQNELNLITDDKNRLSTEIEQLHSQLSQREQLASDVETKITLQIERAKQNAADFISNMAFVSPLSSPAVSNVNQPSNHLSIFNSHIDCDESGEIDDIDTFEEELSDNLTLIGYDDEQSIEISQAISFGIFEKIPLVISENAKLIAQCLAAALNGGTVSEMFIPIQGICIEDLSAAINDNSSKASPMVCLIHGIFDSYSINLFNALSNIMQNWNNIIILLSLEGIPSNMIMPGVWNRAIFIDGDSGFEKKAAGSLHTFTVLDTLDFHDRNIDMKSKEYKDSKRIIKIFTDMLSNMQISLYSRYLSTYSISLDDSNLILIQLIATARSLGKTDHLKELFHENGIGNGEKMLDDLIKE